mgnify:CR=1 FL=1
MNKAYKFAQSKLGLKEIKGATHNPEIVKMFAAVGHDWIKDDETPWCAAFVGWCLKSVDIPHLNEVAARKYEKYSNETKEPKVGDIVVIWRQSSTSWKGHVGFLHSMDETHVSILGGNQGNVVSIRKYPRVRLLSFRSVVDVRIEDDKNNSEELLQTIRVRDLEIIDLKEEILKLRDANARMNSDFIEIEKLSKKITELSL